MERKANENEIIEMEKIVRDAMNCGAIGFSTSTFEGHNGQWRSYQCPQGWLLIKKYQDW